MVQDDSNYVGAWYNNATKKVRIEAVVGGTATTLVEKTNITLTAPVRFAFVLNSKEVTALADTGASADTGGPWKPLANYPNPPEVSGDPAITPGLSQYVDLRDPTVLAKYRYGFGVRGDSGTIVLDGVKAGYWGRAGVRDPHMVTYADGTPYIKDNKLYLTLTNAGLDFFATAHWGVYTLDLSNYTRPDALQEVGKLFFRRDGKVMGDHAGHIVYDDAAGNFLIGVSTWGDFTYNGVHVNYTRKSGDVLHGVNLLDAQPLPLPTPYSSWDPHFALIDGQWYVAFVESPTQGNPWQHYPCLSKGSSIDNLTLVARKGVPGDLTQGLIQSEGMIMQKVGGKWYVLCSTGRGDNTFEGVTPPAYRI
ncbi:MAG: hypothetical protein LC751_21900, partial [Actinobacteria bacterium]|nr:hypothetical protein [Actinomycetota bacterium]